MSLFEIDLFEQIKKDIVSNGQAYAISSILLDYDKSNYDEIYKRLYFELRLGGPDGLGWAPEDCHGLAKYWLEMMDNQTIKWY
jgi:hypothetical protein